MADATLPFDMPPPSAGFDARGGWLVNRLMADLDLSPEQAAGIVGGLGGESGLLAVQEKAPVSGRGGFGFGQWTASRRVAFEHWCADHDLNPTDDVANYGYLREELRTTQAHALEQVKKTSSADAAVYTFDAYFERPADLATDASRGLSFANRALAAAKKTPGLPAVIAAPPVVPPAPQPSPAARETAPPMPQPPPVIMPPAPAPFEHPVHTAIAGGSLGAAVVGLLVYLASQFGLDLPANVQLDLYVVFGAIGAGLLHWRPGFKSALSFTAKEIA